MVDIFHRNYVPYFLIVTIYIKGTKEEKEKIQFVIEELDKFSKEINAFIREQTIITIK